MALILRAADRASLPWKNGGGVTREVAVHPPGSDLDSFDWRVSLAEVREAGPFSLFPGVERQMAVIAGRLELSIAGRPTLWLTAESAPCEFPGDVPASARPLEASVSDLNVMTRRGRCAAQLRRCHGAASLTLTLEADTTLLLALAPLCVQASDTCDAAPTVTATLAPLDALRLAARPYGSVSASSAGAGLDFWLIEIRWASEIRAPGGR